MLNGISTKNLNIFFLLKSKNFFFLKSPESYPKKYSSKSDEKKMLAKFFTFFTFQIDHISKTTNRKIVFFGFLLFSIYNTSFRIIKKPLRIIKSKRLFLREGEGGSQIVN